MQVGCLGNIVFQVSDAVVETISSAVWSGSASYSVHQRHGGNALTEFVGMDPDKFSFDLKLSSNLGVNPMTDVRRLWTYMREHAALRLVIGEKAYGRYRWNIVSLRNGIEHTDRNGNVIDVTVSVELQEYLST